MKPGTLLHTIYQYGLLVLIIGLIFQAGRMMERMKAVEEAMIHYTQTVVMQGVPSRAEYRELRDIHVRSGDIE